MPQVHLHFTFTFAITLANFVPGDGFYFAGPGVADAKSWGWGGCSRPQPSGRVV